MGVLVTYSLQMPLSTIATPLLQGQTPSADGYLPWTVLTDSVPLGLLSENTVQELPVDESFHRSERTNRKECVKRSWRFVPADRSMWGYGFTDERRHQRSWIAGVCVKLLRTATSTFTSRGIFA